jgi:hypothetical protein
MHPALILPRPGAASLPRLTEHLNFFVYTISEISNFEAQMGLAVILVPFLRKHRSHLANHSRHTARYLEKLPLRQNISNEKLTDWK